jgi:hypothetical protein
MGSEKSILHADEMKATGLCNVYGAYDTLESNAGWQSIDQTGAGRVEPTRLCSYVPAMQFHFNGAVFVRRFARASVSTE